MILNRPRIAIPIPTANDTAYNTKCWGQYANAIESCGGIAVPIPLEASPSEVARLATSCCGVVLPGSPADIQPQKYGEERHPRTALSDPAREAVDELLLQDAFHLHKPMFGVCYGHQSINVWRGGTLIQHLDTAVQHEQEGDQTASHPVVVCPGATAFEMLADSTEFIVNSSHHQAVGRVGDGLKISAVSTLDGTIEALESLREHEGFLLGVQWHPERSFYVSLQSRRFFETFLSAARKWQQTTLGQPSSMFDDAS